MSMKSALRSILVVAIAGLLFSGTLTYRELFASPSAQACAGAGPPGTLLGYPPCVYGFFMYGAIVSLAALGLARRRGVSGPLVRTAESS